MIGTVVHDHLPIFRVAPRGWADPLDTTFSQRPHVSNRWNTPAFPALYCRCSEFVARAIVRDIFRLTGVDLADLQEAAQPQLVELHWTGKPIDMISENAIVALVSLATIQFIQTTHTLKRRRPSGTERAPPACCAGVLRWRALDSAIGPVIIHDGANLRSLRTIHHSDRHC